MAVIGKYYYFVSYDHVVYRGELVSYNKHELSYCLLLECGEYMCASRIFETALEAWEDRRKTLDMVYHACVEQCKQAAQKVVSAQAKLIEWEEKRGVHTRKVPYEAENSSD